MPFWPHGETVPIICSIIAAQLVWWFIIYPEIQPYIAAFHRAFDEAVAGNHSSTANQTGVNATVFDRGL